MRTTPIRRQPTTLGRLLGGIAGVLAVLVAGTYTTLGGLVAILGLVLLVGGLSVGTRRLVTAGALTLLGGVLYGGLAGAPTLVLLAGVAGTVFAWDAGGFAIDLGAQLGVEADTARLEAVHAAASAAVAVAAAGIGYGVYLTATGGQPVAALVLLLLAGLLLVGTLDHS